MTDPEPNQERIIDFLLEEYKELNHSLHVNEERGEKRLEFFVTLSSVVLGALGFIVTESDTIADEFRPLIYFIIVLLLLGLTYIGTIVRNRLIKRNQITDGFKQDLKHIREIFKKLDANHIILPSDYTAFEKRIYREAGEKNERKNTSLFHIASVMNCVMIGTAAACFAFALGIGNERTMIGIGVGATIVAVYFFILRNDKPS